MPTFVLWVKAELENVAEIAAPAGHAWCIDVQQAAGTEEKKGVWVDPAEEAELSGSRGVANLVIKFDNKEASASLVDIKGLVPATYTAEGQEKDKWQPLIALECRGLEPIAWQPRGGYSVTSAGGSGKVFEDVEFEDGEWCEYDDEDDLSVEIGELEHEWRVHKEKKGKK